LKISVECKSPLMQKSMEIFLQNYLSATKHCDIIIRDEPCLNDERCFYISTKKEADLVKPFSKTQLILALERKYKILKKDIQKDETQGEDEALSFEILENRIDFLTKQYKENIIKTVKAFYEEE